MQAFGRLQREILSTSDDESIFAWTTDPSWINHRALGMLAPSPIAFSRSGHVMRAYSTSNMPTVERPPYRTTNKGLEFHIRSPIEWIPIPYRSMTGDDEVSLAVCQLACYMERPHYPHPQGPQRVFALLAHHQPTDRWKKVPGVAHLLGPLTWHSQRKRSQFVMITIRPQTIDHDEANVRRLQSQVQEWLLDEWADYALN